MLQNGKTWFVLADGRRARVFAQTPRDDLAELEARAGLRGEAGKSRRQTRPVSSSSPLDEKETMQISEEETFDIQDRPPRSFDRVGQGRHAMDQGRDLRQEEETRFLTRLAEHLTEAEKRGAFDHLVLAAAPRALGELRRLLPKAVSARIRGELAKDVLDETPQRLHDRLRETLAGA